MSKKKTTEEFIQESKNKFGDKFSYDKTDLSKLNEKGETKIFCNELDKNGEPHGYFEVKPYNHLHGNGGCKKCQYANINKKSLDKFIQDSKNKFGDKFSYDKTVYNGANSPIILFCNELDENGKPHGYFEACRAHTHLISKYGGCDKCHTHQFKTNEEFIKKATKKFKSLYDYSKVDINNRDEKGRIIIGCRIHGYFPMTPSNHLMGQGCPHCSGKFNVEKRRLLLSEYDLLHMSIHQLLELISDGIFPKDFKLLTNSEENSDERKNKLKELQDDYASVNGNEDNDENNQLDDIDKKHEEEYEKDKKELEAKNKELSLDDDNNDNNSNDSLFNLKNELENYDLAYEHMVTLGDKQKLLSQVEVQKIWNEILKNEKSIEQIATLNSKSLWLNEVKDKFFNEYNDVIKIKEDSNYKFSYKPSLMQKLMVYKLMKNKFYLNLCGTGAGKTNAFLLAANYLGCKNIVCITPNGVKSSIENAIEEVYPINSNIIEYNNINDLNLISKDKTNYILFNYEKFSDNEKIQKTINKLVEEIGIDFICIDEIHRAKYRTDNDTSKTHHNIQLLCSEAKKYNSNLYVLGMTATPLINNILEVKSLLEIVIGKEFNELTKNNDIQNIHYAYKYLLLHGFRYVPNYGININKKILTCNGNDLIENIIHLDASNISEIETLLIKKKMNLVKNDIKPKTIIYTQFVSNIVNTIKQELDDIGLTYGEFTGRIDSEERDEIVKNDFKNGKIDVLIASSPISTGVDGLQKITNRMIIMSMPWTSAEYQQLIGRINRQGSIFNTVEVIIPQVVINMNNGEDWSWDRYRYNIVENKKTLFDAVVDGIFVKKLEINKHKLLNEAINKLKDGVEDFSSIERKDVVVDYTIDLDKEYKSSRKHGESIIQDTHRKASISSSSHMHEYFKSNPNRWREYHREREQNKKEWVEDPITVMAEILNKYKNKVIADLGCGMNQLKGLVNSYSKWYSFDHFSDDESVIKADIANLKDYLNDNSVDIAVFCMSLWGINYIDYLKEASRYLKKGGKMYIVEPNDKINQSILITGAIKYGFNLSYDKNLNRNGKVYLEFTKI